MKYAIIPILFCVLQTTAPVPRKPADHAGSRGKNVMAEARGQQDSTQLHSPVQVINSAGKKQDKADIPRSPDTEKAITISKVPAVSIQKDRWDYLYISLTGLLVIVGASTWVLIYWQARATADSARAARDAIKLQVETLRPRLMIGAGVSPFQNMIMGDKVIVDLQFINTGGTPGYDILPETWLEFMNIPFTAFSPNAVHQTGGRVIVHPHEPCPFRIPFNRSLTRSEIDLLKAVKATLYLRVHLAYRAFGEKKHTDYVFEITPTTLNICSSSSD